MTGGIPLRVRCGLHAGAVERRDNDYFGRSVNRAARIMSAAHGGQVLLSRAVVGRKLSAELEGKPVVGRLDDAGLLFLAFAGSITSRRTDWSRASVQVLSASISRL